MAEESKGLKREKGTVRPRTGRLSRAERSGRLAVEHDDDRHDRDDRDGDDDDANKRRRRERQGRPPLTDEFNDLNRGGAFVAAESVAVAMDMFSRVLRGAVDRAFDKDYVDPGDVIRGVANEADLAAYDLIDEMRHAPRRLDNRFQDAIRSPRAERGERARRSDDDRRRRD